MENKNSEKPETKSFITLLGELKVSSIWAIIGAIGTIISVSFGVGLLIAPVINQEKQTVQTSPGVNKLEEVNDTSKVVAAGALIVEYKFGEYLMLGVLHIEDGNLAFSPPAGRTETNLNESPTETASRETEEETGYTLKDLKFIRKAPVGNPNFSLVSGTIDYKVPQKNFIHLETAGIIWCDPSDIPPSNWRFPQQRDWIINEFESIVREMKLSGK